MFKNFQLRDRWGSIYLTYMLIMINVGIFILQSISPFITNLFMLHPVASESHWIFQYFTACFLHGSFVHLLMNMLVLFFFGIFIEIKFGKYKFLTMYLVSGVLANIAFHVFDTPTLPALGASGAIFGIITALAVMIPKQKVFIFGLIPAKLGVVVGFMLVYEIYNIFFPILDGIGHLVHVAGAVVGSAFYIFFLRKHR
jgi:membrane associated rhomboid family serine protease